MVKVIMEAPLKVHLQRVVEEVLVVLEMEELLAVEMHQEVSEYHLQ